MYIENLLHIRGEAGTEKAILNCAALPVLEYTITSLTGRPFIACTTPLYIRHCTVRTSSNILIVYVSDV